MRDKFKLELHISESVEDLAIAVSAYTPMGIGANDTIVGDYESGETKMFLVNSNTSSPADSQRLLDAYDNDTDGIRTKIDEVVKNSGFDVSSVRECLEEAVNKSRAENIKDFWYSVKSEENGIKNISLVSKDKDHNITIRVSAHDTELDEDGNYIQVIADEREAKFAAEVLDSRDFEKVVTDLEGLNLDADTLKDVTDALKVCAGRTQELEKEEKEEEKEVPVQDMDLEAEDQITCEISEMHNGVRIMLSAGQDHLEVRSNDQSVEVNGTGTSYENIMNMARDFYASGEIEAILNEYAENQDMMIAMGVIGEIFDSAEELQNVDQSLREYAAKEICEHSDKILANAQDKVIGGREQILQNVNEMQRA